jgi:hypothetical protein
MDAAVMAYAKTDEKLDKYGDSQHGGHSGPMSDESASFAKGTLVVSPYLRGF